MSDTDAEVVAHSIALNYDGDLADAVRRSLEAISGHYAFVAMCDDEPGTLVGVRRECPLVVGLGDGEQFIASSISAFRAHTRRVSVLRDGEIVVLRDDEVTVFDIDGLPHRPASTDVEWDDDRCEKDGFETFMLKEIHEQAGGDSRHALPVASRSGRRAPTSVLQSDAPARGQADRRRRVRHLLPRRPAGRSWRSSAGRGIPVDVEVASEFRYRDPIIGPGTLVLGITQSGETADTLAAMRLARTRGAPRWWR